VIPHAPESLLICGVTTPAKQEKASSRELAFSSVWWRWRGSKGYHHISEKQIKPYNNKRLHDVTLISLFGFNSLKFNKVHRNTFNMAKV
jgi:hypothetical protein